MPTLPAPTIRRTRGTRWRRAVALAATAFGVVLAAAVALVIMRLTLGSTRLESGRTDTRLATEAAERTRIELEDELAVAPLFFYSYVSELERARVCTEDDDRIVQPGAVWPAACGTSWTYTTPVVDGDVFVELTPPSSDDPVLVAKILATSNGRQTGMSIRYALDSAARYTLLATEALDLSALPGGAGATIAGEFYSGDEVRLGRTGYQVDTAAIIAEGGFDEAVDLSPISDGPVRFYGPEDLSGDVDVSNVRELHAAPFTMLRSMYTRVAALACPDAPVTLVAGRASAFCLVPGETLADATGAPVAVPGGATSFLLLPGDGGAGRVGVYWSATTSGAPVTCANPCNIAAASSGALGDSTHPGGTGFWTLLGSFPVPHNGIVHSSEDVHIGLCGNGFTGGGCTVWSGGFGVEADTSLTILAGTLLDPKDVYLSGPITVADDTSFGAVATGRVVLPYWATTPAGTALVAGSYTGLSVGEETADSVETLPVTPGAAPLGALVLDGTLAGVSVDTDFALYGTVTLRGRHRHHLAPPPAYPVSLGTWVRVETVGYTGFDRCGQAVCAS